MSTIQQNVIDALELNDLPAEEREAMIVRVGAIIYQNVLLRVMEGMSEADQGELEKILDTNSESEKVFTFLKNKVPGFENVITEEALKFKNKASDVMDQIG